MGCAVICAGVDPSGVVLVASTQPSDMSSCALVLVTGAELGSLTAFAVPTPAEFATVWAWGFSTVVVSYLIGWSVGAVVNFIKRR